MGIEVLDEYHGTEMEQGLINRKTKKPVTIEKAINITDYCPNATDEAMIRYGKAGDGFVVQFYDPSQQDERKRTGRCSLEALQNGNVTRLTVVNDFAKRWGLKPCILRHIAIDKAPRVPHRPKK